MWLTFFPFALFICLLAQLFFPYPFFCSLRPLSRFLCSWPYPMLHPHIHTHTHTQKLTTNITTTSKFTAQISCDSKNSCQSIRIYIILLGIGSERIAILLLNQYYNNDSPSTMHKSSFLHQSSKVVLTERSKSSYIRVVCICCRSLSLFGCDVISRIPFLTVAIACLSSILPTFIPSTTYTFQRRYYENWLWQPIISRNIHRTL